MSEVRRHVILVEDSIDTLELIGMMLQDDYVVTECSSCAEALQIVPQKRPDILLLDIGMADMDGIACLQEIRRLPGLQNVPAIAVTAYAYPADRARCHAAGFQAFIPKPVIDYDQMRRLIEEILQNGQSTPPAS